VDDENSKDGDRSHRIEQSEVPTSRRPGNFGCRRNLAIFVHIAMMALSNSRCQQQRQVAMRPAARGTSHNNACTSEAH